MFSSIENDHVTKIRGCRLKLEELPLEEDRALRMESIPKHKVRKLARGVGKYGSVFYMYVCEDIVQMEI